MKQTTIRMPDALYERLKEEAKKKGMTWNGFVVSWLWKVAEGGVEVNDLYGIKEKGV